MDKVSKAAALYFKPASIGRRDGARCGACWKFIVHPGACVEVVGPILARKVCGLYVRGIPFEHDPKLPGMIRQVSKEEAGYADGDTHCVSCEYMAEVRASYSPCERVEGLIEPEGCCDLHDPR